ncbi:MAG: phosphoglycerate kinase [Candidatus Babeliaceae bacterium]|nr:phosphoglycerate kinase [Candidatus Babeliaceae bacterium]
MRMLSWNLAGKRVFLRADLNTDLKSTLFTKSLKFQRLLPTLYYLKERGARLTLATHVGKPGSYNPNYSTEQLTDFFIQAGFFCIWSNLENLKKALLHDVDVILLENLRFYPQEEWHSIEFAKKISHDAHFFIEDGFGVLARKETSIITTAQLFDVEYRSIGFAVNDELAHLVSIKDHATKPYMVIVGGGKGREKLEHLYNFFGKVTHIALCPGLSELPEAEGFMRDAQQAGIDVLKPTDYLMHKDKKISIGPLTFAAWKPVITRMSTIVYNGLMGMLEESETTQYTQKLFELFTQVQAKVIIAGGETSLAAKLWRIESKNIYLSTGGGSTLLYLSGQLLPGLEIIEN